MEKLRSRVLHSPLTTQRPTSAELLAPVGLGVRRDQAAQVWILFILPSQQFLLMKIAALQALDSGAFGIQDSEGMQWSSVQALKPFQRERTR